MKKFIKITKEQKNRLMEMLFQNGSDDTTREYHNSHVTADGYVNDTDGGGEPLTGDRFGKMLCKNYPYGFGYYRSAAAYPYSYDDFQIDVNESEIGDLYNNEDSNGDGVEDAYNHSDSNYNQYGDFNDIPGIVKQRVDNLFNALKNARLTPKKQIMLLNYIIDKANLKNIPFSYKKETMKKLGAKK